MKKILIAIIVILTGILIFRACSSNDQVEYAILQENSMLIQQQIFNVSKLIVTEGHFAEVYNFKDSQELFGPLITADKKALVVVNADVTVAYDMNKIDFEVNEEERTLYIKSIPEPEIKINPDFEYYDVTADYLNPFEASDYNKIKENVNASLMKKMEASTLKSNAKNRLISELQKILVLTNSMNWTLVYRDSKVDKIEDLQLTDKAFID